MAVHWGGRGPGHLSRLAKAAGGVSAPAETYHIEIEGVSDDLLLETGDYLLLEEAP